MTDSFFDRRKWLTWTASAAVFGIATSMMMQPAVAVEDYPSQRITLVAPYGTGGSADRLARALAGPLSRQFDGNPVIVVNKPGAGGALGVQWFLQQPDNGYFVLVAPATPQISSMILADRVNFEWNDLTFINTQWQDYDILAISKDQTYQSVEELAADIRDNPKTVSAAIVPGNGGHLSTLLLLQSLGIPAENLNLVTYSGGNDSRAALAGNQVDFMIVGGRGSEPIRDLIRPLAVMRKERTGDWDAPTINEALEPLGAEMPVVSGDARSIIVHTSFKEKHPDRYSKFVAAYKAALDDPEFQKTLAEAKIGGDWLGPEASKELLDGNFALFEKYFPILIK